MNKKYLSSLFVIAAVLLIPALAFCAGSCTFLPGAAANNYYDKQKELTWVCTADGGGNVTNPTITGTWYNATYSGVFTRLQITPATGDDQPTNGFTVYLYPATLVTTTWTADTGGGDFLHNLAASCANDSNTIKDLYDGYITPVHNKGLTVQASGLGAANKFTIKMWLVQ